MPLISEAPPTSRATRAETSHQNALLAGVAVSSFAALLLELALTRLFSVVLFYHFAFLAISIALLGLGSGGVLAHLGKKWLDGFSTRTLLSCLSAINAITVPIVLGVVLHIPVALSLSPGNFLRLTVIYLASAVPFFLTGLQFSVLFARESTHITRLYGADLLGGALACLGVVPLLNWLGGPNTVLFAAFMASVAGLFWSARASTRKINLALGAALLITIAANYSGNIFDVVYAKGLLRDKSWVEF